MASKKNRGGKDDPNLNGIQVWTQYMVQFNSGNWRTSNCWTFYIVGES